MAREYTFLDGLGKAASTQFYAIVGLLNPAARSSVEALRRYLPQARHRLLMLDAMDSLLGATTTERAAMEQVGPLIESLTLLRDSDAGALLELSPVMGRERYTELVTLVPDMVVRFMQLVGPMTADERELLMEAAAPIPLEIVVRILDDPPEDRCSLKDARRFFSRHFKMCYDYDPFDANAPPEEASVQNDDALFHFDAETGNVLFGSAVLGGAYPVDTTTSGTPARHDVYRFVMETANDEPYHHITGPAKRDILTAARARDRAKSKWWMAESDRRVLAGLLGVAHSAFRGVRRRAHHAERKRLEKEKAGAAAAAVAAERAASAKLVLDALESGDKWRSSRKRQDAKDLRTRSLYHRLQRDQDVPVGETQHASKERYHDGKSTRVRETDDEGMPLTAAAASELFGTAPIVVADDTKAIVEWRKAGTETDRKLERRRQFQKWQTEQSKEEQFKTDAEEWKKAAMVIEDRRNQLLAEERMRKEKKLAARAQEKARLKELRTQMRAEAEEREKREAEAELKRKRILLAEYGREARERCRMALAEADQCAIDRYWGIPTEYERLRRLEEVRRREWEKRVRNRHSRMAQVGEVRAERYEVKHKDFAGDGRR